MNIDALQALTAGRLAEGRRVLDHCWRTLASETAGEGKPDPGKLEACQVPAFRLAHLHAQDYAARTLFESGFGNDTEALLAIAFGARVLEAQLTGLPTLALHMEGVGEEALEIAHHPETLSVIQEASTPAFQQELLRRLPGSGAGHDTPGDGSLAEEYRMLRDTFRTFAERKVKPIAESMHREDGLIPDALIREAAGLGCFGLSIPAEHGGAQERPDNLGMVIVTEELSRGALIVGSLITRPEILAKALLHGGTAEQKARFLPPMASGEQMVAISVTEPDTGSDVAGVSTTATPTPEGWRINGTKVWSTFAGRAELIGLLARTEPDRTLGHRGLGMFVVEKPPFTGHDFEHAPPGPGPSGGGRLAGRAIATLGYRGMHSFELTFEDYLVPADNLIGGEAGRGKGFYLQMEGFAYGRLQTSGRALGVMQAAYEAAREYAANRQVFGKALGDFPLSRAKLAAMAASVHAGRQATYAAARLLDQGEGQMEASLVKLLTCRDAEWVTREAMQMHGGMGYAEEFAVSRLFADARVLSIFEGAEEVLALRVIVPTVLKRLADSQPLKAGGPPRAESAPVGPPGRRT